MSASVMSLESLAALKKEPAPNCKMDTLGLKGQQWDLLLDGISVKMRGLLASL